MLPNCDVSVTFLIYGQFGAIPKPDSGGIDFKTYIFIINYLFYLKKYSSRTIALSKGTTFAKNIDFLQQQKNVDISKIKGVLVIKGIFSKTIQ